MLSHQQTQRKSEVDAAAALASLLAASNTMRVRQAVPEDNIVIPRRLNKNGRPRAIPFPLKLMKVLSNKQYENIITWMPSGKSFAIVDPEEFVASVLPHHFKSAQYASFTRKLHRWGFRRLTENEEETGEFYHKDFQKGRVDMAENMTCKTSEPKSKTAAAAQTATKKQKKTKTVTKETKPRTKKPAKAVTPVASPVASPVVPAQQETKTEVVKPLVLPPSKITFDSNTSIQKDSDITCRPGFASPTEELREIELELEALRLKRCIEAAATSRRLLAMIQQERALYPLASPYDMPPMMAPSMGMMSPHMYGLKRPQQFMGAPPASFYGKDLGGQFSDATEKQQNSLTQNIPSAKTA